MRPHSPSPARSWTTARPGPGPRPANRHHAVPPTTSDAAARAPALVDALLAASEGTDRGSAAQAGARSRFDGAFDALIAVAAAQRDAGTTPPLADGRLSGDWDVVYVGVGARQRGQPAGGRFRGSGPARQWLWRTEAVRQGVLPPATPGAGPEIVNRVSFRLCGAVPGHVALRGDAGPVPGAATDDGQTVRVVFDPPILALAPGTPFASGLKLGGKSWVQLATPYVDDRVRLGVGSLGSKFAFVRAAPDTHAATPESASITTKPLGWLALVALIAGLAAAAVGLATRAPLFARPLAVAPALVCVALVAAIAKDRFVTWLGPGDVVEPPCEKTNAARVQPPPRLQRSLLPGHRPC